jgi:hypothetical protein
MLNCNVDSGTLKTRQAAIKDSEGFSTSHPETFDVGVPSIK